MKFNNGKTDADVHIDREKKIAHVFDTNKPGMSVTNAIDGMQYEIAQMFDLDGGIDAWKWLLYGTDGVLCEFQKGAFRFLHPSCEDAHAPFSEKMASRR